MKITLSFLGLVIIEKKQLLAKLTNLELVKKIE